MRRDVARAGLLDEPVLRLERCRPHFHVREAQEVRHQQADRARADDQRALELPRLAAADRPSMSKRALADRGRLREHAEAPERFRNCDQLLRVLGDELTSVAVQACDPALAVVTGQTRVRRLLRARDAVAARAADGRCDELAAREAVAISLNDGQRLVAEHEQRLVLRREPEKAFRDLAVGAAHAHFERADEHFALACFHGRNVFDMCCVRVTRLRDERQH